MSTIRNSLVPKQSSWIKKFEVSKNLKITSFQFDKKRKSKRRQYEDKESPVNSLKRAR